MFQHRSWILQRSNIELLRECQRLIQEQFSEKLSLTQTDLIERIFLFSLRSSNPRFNETVKRLKDSLEEASYDLSELPGHAPTAITPPEPAVGESVADTRGREKVYRGRRVAVSVPEAEAGPVPELPLGDEVTETSKRRRRVYRGRVVEG